LPSVPLSMLIVPERAGIARVRLLVDFLVEEIPRIPGIASPRQRRSPGRSA
ncbi:MAG: LysR family transcriptional regulator, partial [Alphaproteobacteria bacterium]